MRAQFIVARVARLRDPTYSPLPSFLSSLEIFTNYYLERLFQYSVGIFGSRKGERVKSFDINTK